MSIKKIKIKDLSSFINFDFDISKNSCVNKYIAIFGTNGSGKSSLVDMLHRINSYCRHPSQENLQGLKKFLFHKVSKESKDGKVVIEIEFNTHNKSILYDSRTDALEFDQDSWENIRIFNESYTNNTIGSSVNIDFEERGLIIGQSNITLDRERKKQKRLLEQKIKITQVIAKHINDTKDAYRAKTNSKASANFETFSQANFLRTRCGYENDPILLIQREALGKKAEKQKSLMLDIESIRTLFDVNYWEELFNQSISKPRLTQEYKELLVEYSEFYKQGMGMEEEQSLETKCPYCLQDWEDKNQRLKDFEEYLLSKYNQKKEAILGLNDKLGEFELLIKDKNRAIELQKELVYDECRTYSIDATPYQMIEVDWVSVQKIKELITQKLNNMQKSFSIHEELDQLMEHHYQLLKYSIAPLWEIKEAIGKRTSTVTNLNKKVAQQMMKELWENQSELREKFNKIDDLITTTNQKIEALEEQDEDITTIQEVFNGLLKFIGLEEYYLDKANALQLKIDQTYDISNEGVRISTAQRKILSLCYFYAELIANVNSVAQLNSYTLIYDDPVDSADYIFFHSITSLIENVEKVLARILNHDEVKIGQHIVFTHNSLLFNRLTQNFSFYKKMHKVNQKTMLQKADKFENNYKIYMDAITDFYKSEQSSEREKIFIGNIIRRVLEILISFNELNSKNSSIIKDYGKPTLGLIANHLSHDNFSKVLNPLPSDHEMRKACEELFEVIQAYHPKQYEYLDEQYQISDSLHPNSFDS